MRILLGIILLFAVTGCSNRQLIKPAPPTFNTAALNHYIDGAILELLESPKEALFHYNRAADIDSTSPGIFVTMAENYYMLGEHDAAIRMAHKALRLDDKNLNALYILGLCYEAAKDYPQALQVYQQIVQIYPNDMESLYYLASLQVLSLKPKDALKTYRQLMRLGFDDPDYLLQLGSLFLTTENYRQAEQVFLDIQTKHPRNEEAYLALAKSAIVQNDTARAVQWYQTALQQSPAFDEVKAELIGIYENRHDLQSATALFEGLVRSDSGDVRNKLQLGQYYLMAKHNKRAQELYQSAVVRHPESEQAHTSLAVLYLVLQDTSAAMKTCEEGLAQKSTFHRLRALLRDIYADQQRFDEAIALYQPLQNADSTLVGANIEISKLLAEKGDSLQAIQNLEPLMESHPRDWRVPINLGRFYAIRNDLPSAARYFDRAAAINDDNALVAILRGEVYVRMDSLDAALKIFDAAAVKFPNDPAIQYYLGQIFSRKQKMTRAVAHYVKSLELDSSNDQTALSLAAVYDELKQYDQAEELYQTLLQKNPNSPIILNNYAYHLSVQARELDKALAMSQRAVEAVPESAPYLDTLGWIYYQMGDYEKAKSYINASLSQNPDNAEVIEHLGDVYEKLGELETAVAMWRRALTLDDRRVYLLDKIGPLDE